ncbi:mate-domain-containing protein [Phascolomyces articulosus]|uniref:Mate-domain-containing protein n=1 Tax=Phascolomyces articulosus TaxID=60185 RepID=A0AAD5KA24_9FUNG|nr:mate-domain-containing protein [Phascolomyces articulosus]
MTILPENDNKAAYQQRLRQQATGIQDENTTTITTPLLERQQQQLSYDKTENISQEETIEPFQIHLFRFVENATPIAIANLLQQPARWIIIYTAGHLGSTALAAVSLAQTFENASIYILIYALQSAISTLCAQTWTAAKDKSLTGIHLQRGLVIFALMCCFPISIAWYTASYALGYIQQDTEIVHQAQFYLQYQFPGFIAFGVYTFLQVFLEAQGIMSALTYAMIISLPFNALFNYMLVYGEPFTLGIRGVSFALTLTSILILSVMILYIIYVRGSKGWPSLSLVETRRKLFQDWSPLLQLYLPCCFVQCCNTCVQEITILVTSYLGKTELAAQAILLRTHLTFFAFGYAIQIVTANRIGNAIGSGSVMNTQRVVWAGGSIAFAIALLILVTLVIFRTSYPYLFAEDHLVAQAVSNVIPIFSVTQMINMFSALGTGTLDGLGYQKITAASMFVTYFILVGPLGYLSLQLGWIQHCSLDMLWTGMAVGHALVSAAQLGYIFLLDWNMESHKVLQRIRVEDCNTFTEQEQEQGVSSTVVLDNNRTNTYGTTTAATMPEGNSSI